MESLDKEDYEAKDRAFYSAMLGAWLNTKLERDKQLLGLSATAIGLLVTLLRTVGISEPTQIYIFGLALISFLIALVSIICILGENSAHIEKMLSSSETENKKLTFLDKVAGISFIIGMVLVVIIGIHSAVLSLSWKEAAMSKEKQSNLHQSATNNDSWNGVAKLRPQPPKVDQPDSSTTSNTANSSSMADGNSSNQAGTSGSGK